jgi:hypothetical protein
MSKQTEKNKQRIKDVKKFTIISTSSSLQIIIRIDFLLQIMKQLSLEMFC